MISPEVIEEIRQRADIVDVISTYINVIKKGNSFVAVCPFHNDSNPSLQISRTKQIYHCFACGAGGNVFTFVQEYEKIPFIEAVKKVASLIGYSNKELEQTTRVVPSETKNVLNALKEASELYSYTLKTVEGVKCNEYLEKRNIPQDMIDYFGLGYCPADGELSIKMLRSKGISIEDLDKAGITTRNKDTFIDRFKGRLIFPLHNEYAEVVGFSARRIEDNEEAKYVNSLNTLVFNKSKVMYNYQNALKEAKKEGYVYVTEGFMDVFSLYKAGIKSCVAIMGTAFTESHAKMLRKLNVEVRLCLDGDDAGQNGILKMLDILDKERVNYRIVDYKACTLDPDDILQKYGEGVLAKFLNRLISKEEFILKHYKKIYDVTTVSGKKDYSNAVLEFARREKDVVTQEIFLKKLSEITGISFDAYRNLIGSTTIPTSEDIQTNSGNVVYIPKKKRHSRYQKVQDAIISLLLQYKEAIEYFQNGNNYFVDNIYDKLSNYILDCYSINHNIDISSFISFLSQKDDEESKKLIDKVTEIENSSDIEVPYSDDQMDQYVNILKQEMKKKKVMDKLTPSTNIEDVNKQSELVDRYFKQK